MKIIITIASLLIFSSCYGDIDEKIDFYLKEDNLKYGVAKLFVVGYPGDIYNYTKCEACSYLISELQVGGIIINQHNVPPVDLQLENRQVAFNKIRELINDIRIRARKGKRTTYNEDPTLMVDFESYRYSSIKYPLTPPPSALSLASTGDANNSYYAGRLAGYQLAQVGVDVILGPVLDLNIILQQGRPNSTIKDRGYSDNRNIVYSHASAFIDGIKESKIQVYTKHFPSYSSIDFNPHSYASSHVGSSEFLQKELRIFEKLSSYSDGIMTSHLNLGVTNSYLPFTFSKKQMKQYLLNNEDIDDQQLYITDDLSNMEAVREYKDLNKKTYNEIAYEAFMAGHDLLLFSNYGAKSSFRKKNLKDAIEFISQKAIDNQAVKNRLEESLKKIFSSKASVGKKYEVIDFDYDASDQFSGSFFEDTDDFFKSVFKSGVISFKSKRLPNLSDLSSDHKFLVVTEASRMEMYAQFDASGDRYNVTSKPRYNDIESYAINLRDYLRKYDYVYLTVDNLDDANAVDYIRIHLPKLLDKLIILLHSNPSNLTDLVINKAPYILSNFSKNPISYKVDLDFILYGNHPKNISNLPISLNGKSFHDSGNVEVKPHINNAQPTMFYGTDRERELSIKIEDIKLERDSLISKEQTTLGIIRFYMTLIFLLLCIFMCIDVVRSILKNNDKENIINNYYIESLRSFFSYGSKFLFGMIAVVFICLFVSFISDDTSDFLDSGVKLKYFISKLF